MQAASTDLRRRGKIAAIATAVLLAGASAVPAAGGAASPNPYLGNAMWIYHVSQSSGGDLAEIARKAHSHGMETVYIKSSDGRNAWSQFTPALVSYLHSQNLRVCAWQFVYGIYPTAEAQLGVEAVGKGADCLVIDAEGAYEGRYGAADTYMDKLRPELPAGFPISLSSFPFVDYHPGLPYSVFLGPGGARYNLPQLYWYTIGVTVGEGYRHTFRFNRVYKRGMYPVGQTYDTPPISEVQRFRQMAVSYGFAGISWWTWHNTNESEWEVLGPDAVDPIPGAGRSGDGYPVLSQGSRGDLVVWAQEHLRGAGESVPVSGYFGDATRRAVKRFQRSKGYADVGRIDGQTWRALLDEIPQMVDWSSTSSRPASKRSTAESAPRSASLPAVRNEIPPPSER